METHTIQDLVAELDKLWAMPEETFHNDGSRIYLNVGGEQKKYETMAEICSTAECLCDELLITKGGPNWDNINVLKTSGYSVRCTERDSFGWLGAAIDKGNRTLYFG